MRFMDNLVEVCAVVLCMAMLICVVYDIVQGPQQQCMRIGTMVGCSK